MDLNNLKLPFPEKDIEWRMSRCGKTNGKFWGAALAYVNARAVMDRLDEVVGPQNWMDHYEHLQNGVMCTISIKINNEWVNKQNGASESDIESFKGGISNAFKRAAVNWGIGRYLYNLEETFVAISDTRTGYSAKTKEGEWFNWIPPKLPEWALPVITASSKKQELAQVSKTAPKELKKAARTQDTPKTINAPLIESSEIKTTIQSIVSAKRIPFDKVKQIIYSNFGEGAMLKDLSNEEANRLYDILYNMPPEAVEVMGNLP